MRRKLAKTRTATRKSAKARTAAAPRPDPTARGVPGSATRKPDFTAHESAYVDAGARVGAGTRIWHFCHVMPGAVIGRGCSLGQNVVVMNGTRIGNNVKIQNNVSVYEGVELEDDVFCGPSMVFTNVINPRSHISRRGEFRRTLVKKGATIGANATIMCGITLGEYAFVAAGAVVTKDAGPYALMVGVPARRVGWMCRCGVRLPDHGEGRCEACGTRYLRRGDRIEPTTAGSAS
jgi:UDP-2-acetamido-3-amino-2,3-dideoxy-glucuronate N-acetyltransferase